MALSREMWLLPSRIRPRLSPVVRKRLLASCCRKCTCRRKVGRRVGRVLGVVLSALSLSDIVNSGSCRLRKTPSTTSPWVLALLARVWAWLVMCRLSLCVSRLAWLNRRVNWW